MCGWARQPRSRWRRLAKWISLQSAIIRGIFKGRELILGAQPDKVRSPRTLLAWAKELGWAVLGEIPDREIVLGAVTRPWDANPVFRPLPAPGVCRLSRTRLRKDRMDVARRSDQRHGIGRPHRNPRHDYRPGRPQGLPAILVVGFAGVEVIRWVSLRLVKREAEGRIRRRQATLRRAALKDEPIHQASRQ